MVTLRGRTWTLLDEKKASQCPLTVYTNNSIIYWCKKWLLIASIIILSIHVVLGGHLAMRNMCCVAYSVLSAAEPETGLGVFSREVDFMKWFPVAFLTKGAFFVMHGGMELPTLTLRVRMLNHYTTEPL